jgi:hypothetical protein
MKINAYISRINLNFDIMFYKFKKALRYTLYILIVCTVMIQYNFITNLTNELNSSKYSLDSALTALDRIQYKKFDYVSNKFKIFNPDIENSTVRQFMKIMRHYKLDTTNTIYDACISQICLESGARQRTETGEILISSGNAVGITQITPTTAHHYLVNILTEKDGKEFRKLGGSDYTFLGESKKLSKSNRKKLIKWLSSTNNNIILWGYIMRHTLKVQDYDLHNALIVYKDGGNGLSRFIEAGNTASEHTYVVKIVEIIDKFVRKG